MEIFDQTQSCNRAKKKTLQYQPGWHAIQRINSTRPDITKDYIILHNITSYYIILHHIT